jgi:Fibronectin type III domain
MNITGLLAIVLIMLLSATSCLAAEFTLAWDPNCDDEPSLIGYNIYFKAGSSVLADPDGAEMVYIDLTDPGFDRDQPSYTVTDLLKNVRYYFTVTAVYADDESDMSNETSAIKTSSGSTLNSNSDSSSSAGSGAGCFISSLLN